MKISKALQQNDNRVVFMSMPKHRMNTWMEDILNPEEDFVFLRLGAFYELMFVRFAF